MTYYLFETCSECNSQLKNSEVRIQESKPISGGLRPACLLLTAKSSHLEMLRERLSLGLKAIYHPLVDLLFLRYPPVVQN